MQFFEMLAQKWNAFCESATPFWNKVKAFFAKVGKICHTVWRYVIKLKKIILAIPIAWGAIWLALQNLAKLPDKVGIILEADGNFSFQLDRLPAVLLPLMITAVCLLLMFGSRRTLTPWLVSLFSLSVPLVILLLNVFPA